MRLNSKKQVIENMMNDEIRLFSLRSYSEKSHLKNRGFTWWDF
jgi:hypothetical protein